MDNRDRVEELLGKYGEFHTKAAIAQWKRTNHKNSPEDEMALDYEYNDAIDQAEEIWSEVVNMFDREHKRVCKLSAWLEATAKTLAEVTANMGERIDG